MSAERKFQIIAERPTRTLTPELKERWDKLMKRKERLDVMSYNLEKAFKTMQADIVALVKVPPEEKAAYRGFRIAEDGTLWRQYCECPACQAPLQGLTVSACVEEMIRQDMVHTAEVTNMRKRAAELDAKVRETTKRPKFTH